MATSVPPTLVVTPQTGASPRSAVEQASDAARLQLASTGTALPPGTITDPATGTTRVVPGNPAGGQFAPSVVKELPGGQPPAGGQPPQTENLPPAGGQPQVPGQQPPAGTQAAPETEEQRQAREALEAAGNETEEQRQAREAEEALAVELPIMVAGEDGAEVPLVLHADSPENAAALQQLVEQAVSGRESAMVLDNARQQLQQHEDMRQYAGVDPVGFTINMIGNDVENGEALAKFLLSSPTMFERLKPTLQKLLANPNELTNLSNEVRGTRAELREKANVAIQEHRAIQENLQEVQSAIAGLLPKELPDAQRRIYFRTMMSEVQRFALDRNMMTLPLHQLPAALVESLPALGLTPEAAAAAIAVAAARKPGGSKSTVRTAPAAPRSAPPAPAARPPAPKPTGKAFVQSAAARKAVAAIPGSGAGSPGNAAPFSVRKSDGSVMSTEEAIAAHRARLAKGERTY